MASWSAENATEAFLNTLKMGEKAKEPDVAEFISAMAAGNNAQLMVVAYERWADEKMLALAAAAGQTGGRVVCIVPRQEDLELSQTILGVGEGIEFAVGEAEKLVESHYREADFVVIDCNLEGHEGILGAVGSSSRRVVVGFNALSSNKGSRGGWRRGRGRGHVLLPIGKGVVVVTRVAPENNNGRSRWVVKVDKCTGEEHVFRVRSKLPQGKLIIQA